MLELRWSTPQAWVDAVLADFDAFLLDHASAEKKASGMAMNMVAHYPDRAELVAAMIDLALEELTHFRAVARLIAERGLQLGPERKDPYVNALRRSVRQGSDVFLMDRLLLGGIIEARGAERFALVGEALKDVPLRRFYRSIARSERNHRTLFIDLARRYAPAVQVAARLDQWLDIEADVASALPMRAALH